MPDDDPPPPASHTGHMRGPLKDGSFHGTITDVFGDPIHFQATWDRGDYFILGWRGKRASRQPPDRENS